MSAQENFWQKRPRKGKKQFQQLFAKCLWLEIGSRCFRTGQGLEMATACLFFTWARCEWQVSLPCVLRVVAELKGKKIACKLLLSWELYCLIACIAVKKMSERKPPLSLQMCMHWNSQNSLFPLWKPRLPANTATDRDKSKMFHWKSPLLCRWMTSEWQVPVKLSRLCRNSLMD